MKLDLAEFRNKQDLLMCIAWAYIEVGKQGSKLEHLRQGIDCYLMILSDLRYAQREITMRQIISQ